MMTIRRIFEVKIYLHQRFYKLFSNLLILLLIKIISNETATDHFILADTGCFMCATQIS